MEKREPEKKEKRESEKMEHEFCLRCGRKLKNSIARERGYGAVCYKKNMSFGNRPLFSPHL